MKYAELQIGLHQWGANEVEVELLHTDSSSPGEQRLSGDAPHFAIFHTDELRTLILNPKEYGQALWRSLFADPDVLAFFRAKAELASLLLDPTDREVTPGCPLQLRLHIGRRVTTLHDLRWETLCDPRNGEFLATKETIVFSRPVISAVPTTARCRRAITRRGSGWWS